MRKMQLLLSLCLLCSTAGLSQNGTRITGTIQDGQNKQISNATVSLLRAADTGLVKLALTNRSGLFEFEGIRSGRYFLSVSSVGFDKKLSDAFDVAVEPVTLPAISLMETAKSLGGVTVQTRRPLIEQRVDKTIVNVDASPTNAGATALEVLEKSPGVLVNNDGSISLRGKAGVIVMMDGKPTYLSATQLADLLRNMPASAIDQIEIMTNPSSKFDAEGNSGVINIKTKKGREVGFNGSFMVGISTAVYSPEESVYLIPRSQNSFNFNFRKRKINVFGNYNPNINRGRNILNLENRFMGPDHQIAGYNESISHMRFGNENQMIKLGLDWYADKKNIYGIVASGFMFNGHPEPLTVADLLDANRQLESRLISKTENELRFRNATVNLNWKHNFDTAGRELTTDFDWVAYSNVADMLLITDYYDPQLQHNGRSSLRGNLPLDIGIYTLKTDYIHPLKKGKIEAGAKISIVRNDNLVDYDRWIGGKWVRDMIRSNHFIYEENINAAYVNYSRELKKWTVQAGLRVENTIAKGDQVITKSTFKRDTTNLFPTAFVNYKLNEKHGLTLSYGRRIARPNYQDLNPFIYFLDTLTYRQGNIYLRPQYTNNMELSHAYKGKFITTLNYNITNDVISQIARQEDNSKIRYLTVDNVARFRNFGLTVMTPLAIAKWWNGNFSANVFNNHYSGVYDTFDIDLGFTSFMFNITNTFTVAKGFTAELSGFYRHKNLNNLTRMEPIYQMSFGAQKTIIKGKGTIRLNVIDPFAWQQFRGVSEYGNIYGSFHARPAIRSVNTSFTYRFGKNTPGSQPRRRSSSSQEEQNRVGQGAQ